MKMGPKFPVPRDTSAPQPISEINVTPFVDVMLVLLVILWLLPAFNGRNSGRLASN